MLGFAVLSLRNEMIDKELQSTIRIEANREAITIDRDRVHRLEDQQMQLALEYLKQGHEK